MVAPSDDPELDDDSVRSFRAEINADRVYPHDWLCMPWRCWHELSSDRQHLTEGIGGGLGAIRIFSRPQPIAWATVMDWADRNDVADDDRADLLALIRAMDRVFLDFASRRINADLKRVLK